MLKRKHRNIIEVINLLSGKQRTPLSRVEELINSFQTKSDKKKGLVWFGEKVSSSFYFGLANRNIPVLQTAKNLIYSNKKLLIVVGLFVLAKYGKNNPRKVFSYFKAFAKHDDRQIRSAAAIAFRRVVAKNRAESFKYLKRLVFDINIYVRQFVCETLRPVRENKWLLDNPEKSLTILKGFMWDGNMSVKKKLSTNLGEPL